MILIKGILEKLHLKYCTLLSQESVSEFPGNDYNIAMPSESYLPNYYGNHHEKFEIYRTILTERATWQ